MTNNEFRTQVFKEFFQHIFIVLVPVGLIILAIILLFSCSNQKEKPSTRKVEELSNHWEFRMDGDSIWLPATVPGNVHTDLFASGKIPDPFFGLNEKNLQWIGYRNWEYRTEFLLTQNQLESDNLTMKFSGLDTYADVFINGNLVLQANNMFRTWYVNLKSIGRPGKNELLVQFRNVFDESVPKWKSAPFRLMAFPNNDQADTMVAVYNRKAQFHFGWDWGPRLVTAGIWKPVTIESWNSVSIREVFVTTPVATTERAVVNTNVSIESVKAEQAVISIRMNDKEISSQSVQLNPGQNTFSIPGELVNPSLWWSNGLGEATLYNHQVQVKTGSGTEDSEITRIGIRTLELVREADSAGKSFYIRLNGRPVFMKGANYIPQDNFQSRVTSDRYRYILQSAKDANMNMIRVWGGGIYETDDFYRTCDEMGLLVWQDMMFACGMYPADSLFLSNVSQEIADNVKRIRNHPSIALYCGNNENEISWKAWGWKEKYDTTTQKVYEEHYSLLFEKTIPEVLSSVDPSRAYTPSSPVAGIPGKGIETGDTHYWGVWHGKEPFSHYKKNVSRFVSEYGFQSYPELATVESFTQSEDRHLHSEVMLSHQRCMADDRRDREYGNRLIQTYMDQEFPKPKNFESYLYVSQVLQAEGVRQAIYAHRGNQPFCMGSLYWQLDDCWPVASWSSIDYYGNWKAVHYMARAVYANTILVPVIEDEVVVIKGVTDEMKNLSGHLVLRTIHFVNGIVDSIRIPVNVKSNQSTELFRASLKNLPGNPDPAVMFLHLSLDIPNHSVDPALLFLTETKNQRLPAAKLSVSVTKEAEKAMVTIQSDALARYVLVRMKGAMTRFSDNYFTLLPGEQRTISFSSELSAEEIQENIILTSLQKSF